MDYRPPAFRQPQEYNGSLDSIFENYLKMKQAQDAAGLQDLQIRSQYGGERPDQLTPEARARALAGPTITPAVPGQPAIAPSPNPQAFMQTLSQPGPSPLMQGQDPRMAVQGMLGNPGQAETPGVPEHVQYANDIIEKHIQEAIYKKKSVESRASMSDIALKESGAVENYAQAAALSSGAFGYDSNTGKLIPIPRNTKIIPPNEYQKQTARNTAEAEQKYAGLEPEVANIVKNLDGALEMNKDSYGGYLGKATMRTKSALNMGSDDQKFLNTAELVSTIQNMAAKMLKATFPGQISNSEREFLLETMGGAEGLSQAERRIKVEKVRQIAIDSLDASRRTANGSSAAVPTNKAGSNGKIKVSNGSEILHIDPLDEPEALKDGYKRIP